MANEGGIPQGIVLIQDFVNTLELEKGPDVLSDAQTAASWLHEHSFATNGLSESALADLCRLREILRIALLANNGVGDPVAAWRGLQAEIGGTAVVLKLGEPGDVRLQAGSGDCDGVVRATLAAAIYDTVQAGMWRRLKACRKESCIWAFYDQSKNGSGAWCSMATCGNRVKAQRRRQRSSAGGQ